MYTRKTLRAVAFVLFLLGTSATGGAPPGAVTGIEWCPLSHDCLQWAVQPGVDRYLVYRGEPESLPCLLTSAVDSCRLDEFVMPTTGPSLVETPPLGRIIWYLVTAESIDGEGPPAAATAGPRILDPVGNCPSLCSSAGSGCGTSADCCSTTCLGGFCQASCCVPLGASCLTSSDCCSGECDPASFTCVACTPDCTGLQCGDDGCGGSCGSCGPGEVCDPTGQCVAGCTPDCTGLQCGDDGCGGSCGTCGPGQVCDPTGQCVPGCTPDCTGLQCGDDGCGGSCGTCGPGQVCDPTGQCVPGGLPSSN
jgi:hypothetical protein